MQLFKGNSEKDRTTNFISAVRYLRIRYIEKPDSIFDREHLFSNEDIYMISMGISTRKYVQDKYIFRFGVTEDVPVGRVYNLTTGFQKKNNIDRLYFGARLSMGHYYPWGYLSSSYEYATFFRSTHTQQGAFLFNINYFTGLKEIGDWKFRQFVKSQVIIGINRFSSDSLTLNDGHGLDGFNSPDLAGLSRLQLSLQSQLYTPWNLIGFRFGPYVACSIGMLGNAATGFNNSKLYSQIGLGVLIKNENLVFKAFQLSIAFYPIIPGKGKNIVKFNAFKTTDFGFRDFVIKKPETVVFQ